MTVCIDDQERVPDLHRLGLQQRWHLRAGGRLPHPGRFHVPGIIHI